MALSSKNKIWIIQDDELPIRPIKPSGQPRTPEQVEARRLLAEIAQQRAGSMASGMAGQEGIAHGHRTASFKTNSQMRLPRSRAKTGALILITYTLGIAAPLLIRKSRAQAFWSGLGVAGLAPWAVMLFAGPHIFRWLDAGTLPLLPWLYTMTITALLLATVWSRAIVVAGQDERFSPDSLPAAFRHPLVVGALGMLLPGLGLLITGRPRRAALALWNAALFGLSLLAVANTGRLGNWNHRGGESALPGTALDVLILTALAIVALGGLLWIVSALDGFRLALRESSKTQKRRNDWLVVALFASLIFFFLSLQPSEFAKDLDRLSWSRHEEGYRLVPLYLELAAMRLDPAEPAYVLRAADRYDELGQGLPALELRQALRERWRAHAEFFEGKDIAPSPGMHSAQPFTTSPQAVDTGSFPHQ